MSHRSRYGLIALICAAPAWAAPTATPAPPADDADTVRVVGHRQDDPPLEDKATHRTSHGELNQRQPRSAPEALQFSPGVYVQKTGHGQASPFIRGRTGRSTVLLFDGLRLNHALFRQGPNQYFFTVDGRTLDHLDVVRGSASVELGANAMSGAIWAYPTDPKIDPYREGVHLRPTVMLRHATADNERGGRVQLDTQLSPQMGVLMGVGYRTLDQLESGGPIEGLTPASEASLPAAEKEVPRFEADGRTQMGTGFDELTGDLRLVHQLDEDQRLVLAGYAYRQFNAPRTDQCPPPEAPDDWCLVYDEQFRTHVYAKAELLPRRVLVGQLDLALSYQRQHERRRNNRGDFINGGRDDIDVYEARVHAETAVLTVSPKVEARVLYGLDGTYERVGSTAWDVLVAADITRARSRGQYLDGSTYQQGGVWLSPHLDVGGWLTARAGARLAFAAAQAPADSVSDTRAVDRTFGAAVANAGLTVHPSQALSMTLNAEQGFRPPNLDDLTARQLTGQGQQFENPDLNPERADTVELGARYHTRRLTIEGWVFHSWLRDTMERTDATCPPSDRACAATRSSPPVMLTNLDEAAHLYGAELSGRIKVRRVEAKAAVSYAHGEGPSPVATEERDRPLSRVPPLNGTVELTCRGRMGRYIAAALRWATDQDQLSYGDTLDRRIPFGGTPGHAVIDLRIGTQIGGPDLRINAVLENLTDQAWRAHGSSVNGAGRGLILNIEASL